MQVSGFEIPDPFLGRTSGLAPFLTPLFLGQGLKKNQVNLGQGSTGHHSQSPKAAQPASRDYSHQRKIMHKSLNSSGVTAPGKGAGASIDGQKELHNARNSNHGPTKSNGHEARTHSNTLNMSSHMISARNQPPNQADHQSLNVGISSDRAHPG